MKCPKCNNDNNDNSKFCKYCGSDLKKEINDEEKYVEAYVGKNYNNFKTGTFNVGAFFLGPIYLLYRKMYLYAFVFVIISIILSFCIPIVANIVLAFVINGLYLEMAREYVRNVKYTNKDISEEELLNRCRKRGGTTLGAPIIFSLVIVAFFTLLIIGLFFLFAEMYDDISETTRDIELKYDIPSGFEESYEGSYSAYGDNHHCYITINEDVNYNFSSEDEYYKNKANGNDLLKKSINGNTWYYFVTNNSLNNPTYTYMMVKGNKEFEIRYDVYKDDDKYCANNLDSFINSLKIVDKKGLEA